jgi:hypothetical protein
VLEPASSRYTDCATATSPATVSAAQTLLHEVMALESAWKEVSAAYILSNLMSQFICLEVLKKDTKYCCHELRVFCRAPVVNCKRVLPSAAYQFPQSEASVGIMSPPFPSRPCPVHASFYPSTLYSVATDSVAE